MKYTIVCNIIIYSHFGKTLTNCLLKKLIDLNFAFFFPISFKMQ